MGRIFKIDPFYRLAPYVFPYVPIIADNNIDLV